VSINKTYQKSGNGEIIGKVYSISVIGTIVAYMGSPTSSGTFWTSGGYPADESIGTDSRLASVQRKQEALRNLFSTEGYNFEIQSADGSQAVICNPRITDINFSEGLWHDRSEYTISLECDELYPMLEDSYPQYISDANEQWTIDTNEEPESLASSRTYSVSHTVSAVGKRFYDETGSQPQQPWEYAREFVVGRLGFDTNVVVGSSGINLPAYYNGWNHVRNEVIDEQGGSYSVTENWLLASGVATESFNLNQRSSLSEPYVTISVDGNVRGFEERDANMNVISTKWDNASTKFVEASGLAFARAQLYSGQSLNIVPLSVVVGRNPVHGTIDYTFEYDTRPTTLISGAKSETITVNDNVDGEMFASVFVLGRTRGPVLQDLSTKPANTRQLNIELVVQPPDHSDRTTETIQRVLITRSPGNDAAMSASIQNVIDAVDPTNSVAGVLQVFQEQPQESWDAVNGRYSYNTTWTYE
jgi:hypothetical protein